MSKKVFRNFEEFVSLTRPLTVEQRRKLIESVPKSERDSLIRTWQNQGWEDLFIRNDIDHIVDLVHKEFGEGMIYLRTLIKNGNVCKVRKDFWKRINELLEPFEDKHKKYVLEGVKAEDLSHEWVLLVPDKER